MAKNLKRGTFITLEGCEGCGKSTQLKLLYGFLKKERFPVLMTREPGGTAIGDAVRRVLLDVRNGGMSVICETLLYMASRAQLVEEVILPKLQEKKAVLCDRWLDATIAYQGYAGSVDVPWIERLGRWVTQGVKPDLSLFLDLPVACGLRRARGRSLDRMEKKSLRFHEKVRRGYLEIAKREPKRFKRIPIRETDGIGEIHRKIQEGVLSVLCR